MIIEFYKNLEDSRNINVNFEIHSCLLMLMKILFMKPQAFYFLTAIIFMMSISLNAQIKTLTLQPGPTEGKDALIRDDFPATT